MGRQKIFSDDEIVEIQRLTNQDGKSSRTIAEMYGVSKSTIGNLLRDIDPETKPIAAGSINRPSQGRKRLKTRKGYVFTSAQNNTFVHDDFLRALIVYCEHNDYQLVIGTFIYHKNGFQQGARDDTWFDPKIRPYILDESMEVAKGLVWAGELNVLPTAKNPLSGLQNYTNQDSCIMPHAKLQMESIPTPIYQDARMMYTTGTVTQRNYRPQKAGQAAEHHHSFSAMVVEIDKDGDWFPRQLCAERSTGNFYDVTRDVEYYTRDGVTGGHGVEAINWGDIHSAKLDHDVAKTSWGRGGMIDIIKPRVQFLHDLYDQKVRNHHNIKDPYFMYEMFTADTNCVLEEVKLTGNVVKQLMRNDVKTVVVQSNHDMALKTWLQTTDYRYDPANAEFFLEMQLKTYREIKKGNKGFSVLEYAMKKFVPGIEEVRFLSGIESYRIAGDIECGSHGNSGNGGARGSTRSHQIQGIKYNIGHQHSANIKDGVFVSGVSGELNMGYNAEGGSGWSHTHIVTYKNGKRTLVTLRGGKKWRG